MTYAGYSAYNRIASTIDSKEMMLVKLLEGTVRFIQAARAGLDAGNPKVKGENISRVIAIITELDCALDRDMGGSLVENLSDLYQYILNRLTLGNLRNDDQILGEVETLLATIKEGFSEALKQVSSAMVSDHAPSHQLEPQRGFSIAA
ncbi:MAG: flagellar export chaperone FliS [Deltaproteobacteria bacterium]|nr:flagellar export chaperone FliS [Deltaproteobacteria bacterium]